MTEHGSQRNLLFLQLCLNVLSSDQPKTSAGKMITCSANEVVRKDKAAYGRTVLNIFILFRWEIMHNNTISNKGLVTRVYTK